MAQVVPSSHPPSLRTASPPVIESNTRPAPGAVPLPGSAECAVTSLGTDLRPTPILPGAEDAPFHDDHPASPDSPTRRVWGAGDKEEVRKKVRESLLKAEEPHTVADDYWKTGIVQAIAISSIFENVTLAVITLNAIWLAIDTDWNTADLLLKADPVFIVAENLFCVYFSGELMIRFLAFEQKRNCFRSGWFVFDTVLVFFMVTETWVFIFFSENPFGDNTAILRLFRLLRLTRLMKMFKSMPQLMILIKGMMTAMLSVSYVFFLLIVITYIFAIMVTQLTADAPAIHEAYFDSVALSMYSLLIYGTFLDALSDFCDAIRAESPVVLCIVMVFIGLSAMTVMNMLIGVLCTVVDEVSLSEKEALAAEEVAHEMRKVLKTIDADNNGMISINEMKQILEVPAAVQALAKVGVDPVGMMDFAEIFFMDDKGRIIELQFERFMEMVMDLRSSNNATLKDIMNLGKQVNIKFDQQKKDVKSELQSLDAKMEANFTRVEKMVSDLTNAVRQGRISGRVG